MISPGRPFRYSEGTHQNGMRDAVYQTGPQIVYGTTSVYRVEQRENRDDTNVEQERLSYVLRPLYQDGRILNPSREPQGRYGPPDLPGGSGAVDRQHPSDPGPSRSYPWVPLKALYHIVLKRCTCVDLLQLAMLVYAKKQEAEP